MKSNRFGREHDVEFKYCDVLKRMTVVHLAPFIRLTCSLEPEMDTEQKPEANFFQYKYADVLGFNSLV